ncbi:hypothetical protein UY3_03394 [Chelonia mydas]|uniref:Uncharacterized protein n=1 Tax=Chelonia mydas TaxID=8469 RepID=M7CEX6_CHEMY|nr:hypothetical protein UY3_03394 [Chelonia mydas]
MALEKGRNGGRGKGVWFSANRKLTTLIHRALAGGDGGVSAKDDMQQFVKAAGLRLCTRSIVGLPCLLVCLLQLLGFYTSLLLVPVVALLLHVPSNLFVDVNVSMAGSELSLHGLFSPQAQEIQYLEGTRLQRVATMVSWAVAHNNGELLGPQSRSTEVYGSHKEPQNSQDCGKSIYNGISWDSKIPRALNLPNPGFDQSRLPVSAVRCFRPMGAAGSGGQCVPQPMPLPAPPQCSPHCVPALSQQGPSPIPFLDGTGCALRWLVSVGGCQAVASYVSPLLDIHQPFTCSPFLFPLPASPLHPRQLLQIPPSGAHPTPRAVQRTSPCSE